MLSVNNYKYKSWQEKFPNGKVILEPDIHSTWIPLFSYLISDEKFTTMENKLGELVKKNTKIYPYPEQVFSAFKFTPLDKLKVVIIGQDPYFRSEKGIPQAMGLSFSVPIGLDIPSSLKNIYANMIKYKHLSSMPKHGNLEFLAYQGCLFLNTTLTVTDGQKNSHSMIWKWFTDEIIKRISEITEHIIFVLWGGPALEKLSLIDLDKHEVIISSHPSGLSYDKPLKNYSAYRNQDHFGKINEILKKNHKTEIVIGL